MPKTPEPKSGVFLWAEFLLLLAGGPLLILYLRRPGILFLLLWIGGFICNRATRPAQPGALPDLQTILRRIALIAPLRIGLPILLVTKPSEAESVRGGETRAVLLRFIVLGTLLTLATRYAMPARFLDLPRHRPILWVAIMLLYPLLSVWPQEVIFRRFLLHRYAPIFGERAGFLAGRVGAEGKGLRRMVKNACDALARLPMAGPIASLNASVAGAIALYEVARQRTGSLAEPTASK